MTSDVRPSTVAGLFRPGSVEIDTTPRRLAEYSFDASNYRVAPIAVAFPKTPAEVSDVVNVCRRRGFAVTARGGGTSMAGNAIGNGVVLDFSRYMNRIVSIDRHAKTAVVEPGVVLSELAAAVEACTDGRLTFAPDPSSKNRATVGGSVANDACGNHSVRYGRTSDHVDALDLVIADGTRLTATRSRHQGDRPRGPPRSQQSRGNRDRAPHSHASTHGRVPLRAWPDSSSGIGLSSGTSIARERVRRSACLGG